MARATWAATVHLHSDYIVGVATISGQTWVEESALLAPRVKSFTIIAQLRFPPRD